MERVFRISEICPAKCGLTISHPILPGVCLFSMGEDTSISQETYDQPILYIAECGKGSFALNNSTAALKPGQILYVQGGTLCGTECSEEFIYTEIILLKENLTMNEMVKAGAPLELKALLDYEKGSIVNLDIFRNDTMKFVVMAFDEGTGLTPHRAPGNAILTALEGKAIIGYEGEEFPLEAGQSFRFAKDGLHSVTPQGKFKMSLLLVME